MPVAPHLARVAGGVKTARSMLDYGANGVWTIEVHDSAVFVVVDEKGNDHFETVSAAPAPAPVAMR
jgi:tartrate dehydratase beta subunit/fumarate hydratase class I family protein